MRSRSVFMMSLAHSWMVPNKMPVRRRRLEPRNRAGPHTVGVRSVTWRNRCRECTGVTVGGLALLRRSEEHTSELQSLAYLVCRLLLEKKKKIQNNTIIYKK